MNCVRDMVISSEFLNISGTKVSGPFFDRLPQIMGDL